MTYFQNVRIFPEDKYASFAVARRMAQLIRASADQHKNLVLGLATGHTPVNIYRQLIEWHRNDGLDLSGVITFNLDEYWPIDPNSLQSYHNWMHENFFNHVNIPPENIHIPRGDISERDIAQHCRQYEQAIDAAGGIDFQILGIGRSGHIGFNEPGSPRESFTRRIHLDSVTRKDAASDFFGEEHVPQTAITMGVGSILKAREIALLAFGEHKASIMRQTIEEPLSADIAASFLQQHANTTCYLDLAADADLQDIATPWLLGTCQWDDVLKRHAVIWLATKLRKPILKLTEEDYGENGLAQLLRLSNGSYHLNIEVFRQQMNTITGWPGGKQRKKRVLVLSPHPDDDVICMGGTVMRFIKQEHDLHLAYMVSGYLSVFDHDVSRFADFVTEFNHIFGLTPKQTGVVERHIEQFLHQKKPCDIDTPEIQAIKSLIRKTEAVNAAKFCGVPEENIHFLNMPFYQTGKVQKLSVGADDIKAVSNILRQVKPEIVFAAGDVSDPHGTHRLCLDAALVALEKYLADGNPEPELWLYRGAWQEWAVQQIDMAVPLAPEESKRKRFAIFRHESQKDRAMFPGPYDSREFWQRAEERNMTTAVVYDQLGLPEYHALEAFVRYPLKNAAHIIEQIENPQDQ